MGQVTDDDWDGHERRQEQRRSLSPEEIAAVMDAEKLSTKRYRRERIFTVAMSVVAALLVGVVVSVVVGHRISSDSRYNATTNCHTQADGRPVGNGRALVSQVILRIADDAFKQFPPEFQRDEVATVNAELRRKRAILPLRADGKPLLGHINNLSDLSHLLGYLRLLDCSSVR